MPARLFLLAVALLALLPAGAQARSCAAPGRTVAASETARVYAVGDEEEPTFFGCRYGSGRRMRLGAAGLANSGPRDIRLAGDRAFFKVLTGDRATGDAGLAVRVVDLRRRRTIRRWSLSEPNLGGVAPTLALRGARLRQDGSVAFLAGPVGVERAFEVHGMDASGEARRLDASPGIDPRSLAVGGSRLYWTRDGAARFAPFSERRARRARDRSPASRCSRPRSRTVALTERVRVLAVAQREDPDLETYSACLLRTGRLVRLGEDDFFCCGPRLAGVAGTSVLTTYASPDRSSGDVSLAISTRDLRRGGGAGWSLWGPADLALRASTLRADGSAAYLAGPVYHLTPAGYAGRFEVHASTAGGATALLDAGEAVDPGSFAAGERRIYWVHGGAIRTAEWP